MKKREKLTIEEHIRIGAMIKKFRTDLFDLYPKLPKASPAMRTLRKLESNIDALRSQLEDVMCEDHRIPPLTAFDVIAVYYGDKSTEAITDSLRRAREAGDFGPNQRDDPHLPTIALAMLPRSAE